MRRGFLLIPLALVAGTIGLYLCAHTQKQVLPTATKFRAYLANPASRMVVYSPTKAVLEDPQHRVMREQLTMLRTKFDGLSIYQTLPDTPAEVGLARELGYKAVLLTIWDPRSESELATVASILRDNATGLAFAVSIGSEGLMESRYTLDDLAAARQELRDRATGPAAVEVTTTEPWWLYLKPEDVSLLDFGDFTSANIHVVWDTDITDPALAATWTRDRANELKAKLHHPLLIREAGLPGGGTSPRDNTHLVFTRDLQQKFWQTWQSLPNRPASITFEAIDNPEKHWRDFESTWGLLDTNLQPWPAWSTFPQLPH